MNAKEARDGHDKHKKKGYTPKVELILAEISKYHKHLTTYTHVGSIEDQDVKQLQSEGYQVKVDKKVVHISW